MVRNQVKCDPNVIWPPMLSDTPGNDQNHLKVTRNGPIYYLSCPQLKFPGASVPGVRNHVKCDPNVISPPMLSDTTGDDQNQLKVTGNVFIIYKYN